MGLIKKVLANVAQSLSDDEKRQARENIGVKDTFIVEWDGHSLVNWDSITGALNDGLTVLFDYQQTNPGASWNDYAQLTAHYATSVEFDRIEETGGVMQLHHFSVNPAGLVTYTVLPFASGDYLKRGVVSETPYEVTGLLQNEITGSHSADWSNGSYMGVICKSGSNKAYSASVSMSEYADCGCTSCGFYILIDLRDELQLRASEVLECGIDLNIRLESEYASTEAIAKSKVPSDMWLRVFTIHRDINDNSSYLHELRHHIEYDRDSNIWVDKQQIHLNITTTQQSSTEYYATASAKLQVKVYDDSFYQYAHN